MRADSHRASDRHQRCRQQHVVVPDGRAAAVRLCEILDTPSIPESKTSKKPDGVVVEVNDVSYSYGDTQALRGVSLVLNPGTTTALIGRQARVNRHSPHSLHASTTRKAAPSVSAASI